MPPEGNNRELLRQTFNTAAAQYQEARPEYPGELYAALIALAGLRPEADTLCEVGAGPGKARSAAASPPGPAGSCAATGARCCTWRAGFSCGGPWRPRLTGLA